MHVSIAQTLPAMTAGTGAWLMLRLGAVKLRRPERCASCGKLRTRGGCGCTGHG